MKGPPRLRLWLAVAVAAIVALYLTVWPHELGHAAAAWLAGCKASWWSTDTSWFLWGSFGGAIDEACLERRGTMAFAAMHAAGILVNLLFLAVALLVGRLQRHRPEPAPVLETLVSCWGVANAAEAFSYLIVNALVLRSDVAGFVAVTGIGRGVVALVGAVLAAAAYVPLRAQVVRTAGVLAVASGSPVRAVHGALVSYGVVTAVVMVMARLALT